MEPVPGRVAQPVPIEPDVMPYVYGMNVPPEVIYIIRHAEARISRSKARKGTNSAQAFSQSRMIAG